MTWRGGGEASVTWRGELSDVEGLWWEGEGISDVESGDISDVERGISVT